MLELLWTLAYVFIALWSAIFIHEVGHLLAAKCVGLVIGRFNVGTGPLWCKSTWRGIGYNLHVYPTSGEVKLMWLSRIWWRNVIVYSGGPAANLVSCLLALVCLEAGIFIQVFALTSGWVCLRNLIPSSGTDGEKIILYWRQRHQPIRPL
jgi:membrane-associated protease RseP (regulator of RpoE activity)